MRNYYFYTVLVGLLFMGCTVDNDELNFKEDQIQTANLKINDVCMPSIYGIENSGELLGNVTVSNSDDGNMAYVKFTAETKFYITEIRLMQADDENGLPINNGGVISGKLEKLIYPYVTEVDFEYEVSSHFVLAARVTFVDQNGHKYISWIGHEMAGNNRSTYLSYNICIPPQHNPVCEVNAGSNNSRTYTFSEVDALIDDVGAIEPLYKTLLDEGVSRDGTFAPTAAELLRAFNQNPYREFTTVYTLSKVVGGVVCKDSTELTITVIPD